MTIDRFNPTIWSAKILTNLHKKLVYGSVCNTDYEGEISAYGQVVKIHSIGAVTVVDYTKNQDLAGPEVLSDNEVSLTITESKAFNFIIDDIDKAQQNPKVMGEAAREAAYALANVADRFVASKYTDAAAGNVLGSAVAPVALSASTAGAAYDLLVDLKTKLDRADVPAEDRTVVVPPEFEGLALKDVRFVMNTDGPNFRETGVVARVAGFDLKISNNVPQVGADNDVFVVQASHRSARSFAGQILETEAYRPERRFGDALKGLHVYGAKVVRPTCLAVAFVTVGA